MRPDLDDFDELNEADAPRSRAMSWLVLVVAVGGFAALAYYAYHSGSQSMRDGQVLVVQADQNPIKTQPDDRGGEHFPNQDKTIYDALAPSTRPAQVEKLLPEPEEPVIPEPATEEGVSEAKPDSTTTTYVKAAETAKPAEDPVDVQSLKQGAPPVAPEAKVTPTRIEPKDEPVAKPAMVNVKPVQSAAKAAPKKVETSAAAKPAAASAGGAYKIQLGAFKSEAEARTQWGKIIAKHGDVISGSPVIVRAALPNGVFYRLRATGYGTADAAKAACAKLSARGQACFYAGK